MQQVDELQRSVAPSRGLAGISADERYQPLLCILSGKKQHLSFTKTVLKAKNGDKELAVIASRIIIA